MSAGLLLAAVTSMTGCRDPVPERRAPVIVLAVDGLEWGLVMRLCRQGLLPEFEDLLQRGCYGRLRTLVPTHSPAIWTTVATGKLPAKHGIPTFAYQEEGQTHLYTSGHRKTKALWNILSEYDRTVHSIGWWNTFPVEPIRGVMVAQTSSRNQVNTDQGEIWKGRLLRGAPQQVHPPDRAPEIFAVAEQAEQGLDARLLQTYGTFTEPMTPLSERLWRSSRWSFLADETYYQIALHLLETDPDFDALLLYLGGVDVVSHRFWRYLDPASYRHPPSEQDLENFQFVVQATYCWVDSVLGELRRRRPDASLVLLSDHGFYGANLDAEFPEDASLGSLISGDHGTGPPALFAAVGDRFRVTEDWKALADLGDPTRVAELGGVEDVAPTLLALLGLPFGEDMDGRPLRTVFRPEFLSAHAFESVASLDDPAWRARRSARLQAGRGAEEIVEAITLEQLRELGYLPDGR